MSVKDIRSRITAPHRTIDVRLTCRPDKGNKLPFIAFSHGRSGSREFYDNLVGAWVDAGYAVIRFTHGDSASLHGGQTPDDTSEYVFERADDMAAVIDQLPDLVVSSGLEGFLDPTIIGVGGHSLGARTALMAAGLQLFSPRGFPIPYPTVPQAKAFLAMSPPGTNDTIWPSSFTSITRPCMLLTGSEDAAASEGQPPEWRLEAWEHLPKTEGQYLAFFEGAYHNFGGITDNGPITDPQLVEYVRWTTQAFWDAHLKGDTKSLQWLAANGIEPLSNGIGTIQP